MAVAFLRAYRADEVVAITGLTPEVFTTVYEKYCGPDTPIRKPIYLWWLFSFYKLYPVTRAFPLVHGGCFRSPQRFLSRLYVWERHLASVIDELSAAWDGRWHPANALPHVFARTVTGSVDTFPILINRPSHGQSIFYNGKYKAHVVKVQGVCDHRGNLIWYSGPHIGRTSDIALWRAYPPPLERHERLLGDKAYSSRADRAHLIAPYKKRKGADRLRGRKWHFNNVHAWYRATVEHCFAYVKRFRILNSVFRGHILRDSAHLAAVVKIIMHTNYLHTADHPQRTHADLDPALVDVPDLPAAAFDPEVGTGFVFADFAVGDTVEVWYSDDWWVGKVTYKARAGTLSVRFLGTAHSVAHLLPQRIRPFDA
jgi:hypothetical protein